MRVAGTNPNFTGSWVVEQGTLDLDAINAARPVQVNGGTFAGHNAPVGNAVTLVGGKLSTTAGDNTDFRGTVSASGNFTVDLRDYTVPTTSRSLTISGLLSGTGTIQVSGNLGSDKALVVTNSSNTYSGSFVVDPSQTLTVQPTGTGSPLGTASVQLTDATLSLRSDGAGSNGLFNFSGNNLSILGTGTSRIDVNRFDLENGTNTGNTFRLGRLNMGAQTLSVVGGNGYRAEINGTTTLTGAATFQTDTADLVLKGAISGSLGFIKTGEARLVLEGNNNTLTGNITVEGGTLVVNGSLPNGNVNVNGGRVGGIGTITNSVLLNSPVSGLAPGDNGPGRLRINGNLTFSAGADFDVEVGSSYDQVFVGNGLGAVSTGAVQLAGGELKITLGSGLVENNLYYLLINDGNDAIGGTFLDLSQGEEFTVNGQGWRISYAANSVDGISGTFTGGNDIALMAVPEPGSVALILGGLGLVAANRRRRIVQ